MRKPVAKRRRSKPRDDVMHERAGEAATLLKAVGNENRLMVLCALAEGELCVSDLQQRISLSQSALSQHLAILRREKLVETRRESQQIFYSLPDGNVRKLIEFLYSVYCG